MNQEKRTHEIKENISDDTNERIVKILDTLKIKSIGIESNKNWFKLIDINGVKCNLILMY